MGVRPARVRAWWGLKIGFQWVGIRVLGLRLGFGFKLGLGSGLWLG